MSPKAAIAIGALAMMMFAGPWARLVAADSTGTSESAGEVLAQKILSQIPTENLTNNGFLKGRDASGKRWQMKLEMAVSVSPRSWLATYIATEDPIPGMPTNTVHSNTETLWIVHTESGTNAYYVAHQSGIADTNGSRVMNPEEESQGWQNSHELTGGQLMQPFGGSDFWAADLGLEFLHWPQQRVLRQEIRRSRGCTVLESETNTRNGQGYCKVTSWIDNESLGILDAEAYDSQGKKLKEFYPKDFKKVRGQWQVETMTMDNQQNGSRSRLEIEFQ